MEKDMNRYMTYHINTGEKVGHDTIEETLLYIDDHVYRLNEDWVIHDLESCGVSDPGSVTIIDITFPTKSPYYKFVEELIIKR